MQNVCEEFEFEVAMYYGIFTENEEERLTAKN